MKVVHGDRDEQWRILREQDMLCGLITKVIVGSAARFRVEMFMRIDAVCDTHAEATAFVKGVFATCDAFNIFKRSSAVHRDEG